MSDISRLLSLAVQHHQNNQFDTARQMYQQVLSVDPNQPDALHLYGLSLHQSGNSVDAESFIRRAVTTVPDNQIYLLNFCSVLKKLGKSEEAAACYRKILSINPAHVEAWYGLGNVLRNLDNIPEAIDAYRQAVSVNPKYADAYINLGVALSAQGKTEESLDAYRRAIEADPNRAELHYNMGTIYQGQKRLNEAIACFQKALELKPTLIRALNNMGNAFQDQGKLDDALASYRKALETDPQYALAWHNAGNICQYQGNFEGAISYYRKASELKPNDSETLINMGMALKETGQFDESLNCFRKVIETHPDHARAYGILIHLLQHLCLWDELPSLVRKMDDLTTRSLEKDGTTAEGVFENIARNFSPERNLQIAAAWCKTAFRAVRHVHTGFDFSDRTQKQGRIRIGYLSNDFYNHPVAHLIISLFGLHDRSKFEIIAYSYGRDDGSRYRRQIETDSDLFVDLRALSYEEAARRIYADKTDILIDLMGHTKDNRMEICAYRPAPIQMTWLGFPGTIGADFFDYILTDKTTSPIENAPYFSEKPVYLPHSYLINDYQQPISDKTWTKADLGFNENTFIFSSYNQSFKIDSLIFDTWMRILKQVTGSVLWLQRKDEAVANNLRREAQKRGIEPERLIFLAKLPLKEEYLARLNLVDIALDTKIYNGHATTCDALWAGVPVITLQGTHIASRAASSALYAVGLSELITRNIEEYEHLAIFLAKNPSELVKLRQKLAKNRLTEPLFDTPRFVENLEKAYQEMWNLFQAGGMPREITVQSDECKGTEAQRFKGAEAQVSHYSAAKAAFQQEQYQQSVEYIQKAIQSSPKQAEYYVLLSMAYQKLEKPDPALKACQKALEFDPNCVDAWHNMGVLLEPLGKLEDAKNWLEKVLKEKPDDADTLFHLGNVLLKLGEPERAFANYQKVVEKGTELERYKGTEAQRHKGTEAQRHKVYFNMGIALEQLGRYEQSLACLKKALSGSDVESVKWKVLSVKNTPHNTSNLTHSRGEIFQAVLRQYEHLCMWQVIEGLKDKVPPKTTIEEKAEEIKPGFGFDPRKVPHKKLRVGYLWHKDCAFPIAHLKYLIEAHDPAQADAIGYCFSPLPLCASEPLCLKFTDIRNFTPSELAARIYTDNIDILVDFTEHYRNTRLVRPAPVMVNFSGKDAGAFDYLITDRIRGIKSHPCPSQEGILQAKTVLMPNSCQMIPPAPVSDKPLTRKDFGLPPHAIVFCAFHPSSAIEPRIFDVWMNLLKQVPGSVLWLSVTDITAQKNLKQEAAGRGVDSQRLIFTGAADNPMLLDLADIALDLPTNHFTLCTLHFALPSIAFHGTRTAELLSAANLPQLAVPNLQAYQQIALQIASNPGLLFHVRQRLCKYRHSLPVFDSQLFVRDLEKTYQAMWFIFVSGQPVRDIDVAAEPSRPAHDPAQYFTSGAALQSQNKHDEAIAAYEMAVRLKPDYLDAWVNLGVVWKNKGNDERAIFCYRKALEIKPDFGEVYYNLGNSLRNNPPEAIANYQKAVQHKPDMLASYLNMGICFHELARSEEAIACYEKALTINPNLIESYSNMISRLQHLVAWSKLERIKGILENVTQQAIAKGVKTPEIPFDSLSLHTDPARHLISAKSWTAETAKAMAPHKINLDLNQIRQQKAGQKKLTIAYVSCDFRNHPVSHLLRGMFKLHNRSEFQVYAYSFGPDDPSIYRKEIRESCDKFTDIHAMSHQDAAKLIAQDGVDILIDLMGHTKNARLDIFALRPAPVQVTWLGYPGTSGAEFIDYILTDKVVSPREHAQYYSEQLVYLPHCYLLSDHQQGIWTPPPTRKEVGLPEDRFVFCSFNQAFKIEARLFDCWMNILRQLPESVLWLSSPPESGERNMKRQAELRGIDSSRLLFTGKIPMKDQFLARLGLSDLVLDPWVYNGHTTTLDALWAGVPVVSLQGKTFASRVSSGMMTVIDLPELITYTHQDYEKLILRLATHPDELLRIRQKLSKNRLTTPLFDTPRFVKNLENAFREMWKVFMSGQAPRPIDVPDAMTHSYLPDYAPLPNINQSLSDAFQLQNSGQNGEALALYDKILVHDPNHADAWHLSGLAAYHIGNYEDAIARIRKAIELSPSSAMYHSNLSAVYYDMKRYEDVIASCQKALELNPQFADAHINMGLSLKHLGKPDQALCCYDNALKLRPDHAEIWFNRAGCLQALGQSQQAIESYNKAIALKPDYPSAYFNRGNVFLALGQQEDARDSYNSALKYRPDYIEAIVNKGVSFQNQEKFAEAETCYRQVIAIRGDYLAAYTNLAALLKRQEKFQDAADLYEKAAQLNPSDSALCSEAGECRLKLYQFESALSWFRRAMSLNPDNNRGFSQLFHQLQYSCSWEKMNEVALELDAVTRKKLIQGQMTDESPFMSVTRKADLWENFEIAKLWARSFKDSVKGDVLSVKTTSHFSLLTSHSKRLRIGYLSNDFRHHPVAHLMLGMLSLHDRNQFEVYCYSYGKDDGTEYRSRAMTQSDCFRDIREFSHKDAAQRIADDEIDILIDLMGYTTDSRLEICALRPAKIQVVYLGFPGTTGADYFDYILCDKIVVPPEHRPYYSECPVYLPHTYQVNDHHAFSEPKPRKSDLGLPENRFIFCSFNQAFKIEPNIFDAWMRILHRVPDSVLWLIRWSGLNEANLRREAAARGIDPQRLIFARRVSKSDHLARHTLADLALDTMIYNGHTTTSDALWAGVPVIALKGKHFASRVSESLLNAIGMPELVVNNLQEYEASAIRLAYSPDELKTLRQKIAKNRITQPLFDTPKFTRNIENAYRMMWEQFSRGEMPEAFEVRG